MKRINYICALIGLLPFMCCGQDIEIKVPHQPQRPPAVDKTSLQLPVKVPYENSPFADRSTLGQLCKMSERVVICSFCRVRSEPQADSSPYAELVYLGIDVNKDLLGSGPEQLKALVEVLRGRAVPEVCERAVVFLSKAKFSEIDDGTYSWEFDRNATTGKDMGKLLVVGGDRGIIEINKENEKYLLRVVAGYLQNLRGRKRNSRSYHAFLTGLLKSSEERIRKDAGADLFRLLRYLDDDAIRVVAENEDEGDDVREYAKWLLERRSKRPRRGNVAP